MKNNGVPKKIQKENRRYSHFNNRANNSGTNKNMAAKVGMIMLG